MSWSSINRRFPNATFDSYQKSWIVKAFFGTEQNDEKLKQMVSDNISKIQATQMGISTEGNNEGKETAITELAKGLGLNITKSNDRKAKSLVMPESIHLIEPTEASVEIFPKGLWCSKCKFYGIFRDFSRLASLNCPNCKEGTLEQRSNFFLCPRCGKQEEMIPPLKKLEDANPAFRCSEQGCDGNLFLNIGNPLSRSKWFCSRTKNEIENLRMICMDCSRFRGQRDIVTMEIPFTSASYYKPEKISAVFDKDNIEFEPSNVVDEWSMEDTSSSTKENVLRFGIKNIQIVDEINAIDIVYGYKTQGMDAMHKFFNTSDRKTGRTVYDAYINKTKGKGLLISLNKETVATVVLDHLEKKANSDNDQKETQRISDMKHSLSLDVAATYKILAEEQISKISGRVISKTSDIPLIRLLHSFEHALVYQAPLSTGLEETSFQSKIFLRDCAVLIYERDEVEAGGVEFLCKNLLSGWLSDARRHVIDCRYSCSEGCVTCLFIQDPLCHPLANTEIKGTYILPNSILSRELLIDFWNLRNVVPIIYKGENIESQFRGT